MQTGTQGYVRKLDQHGWDVRSTQSVRYSVRFYDGLFSNTNTILLRVQLSAVADDRAREDG
jgi:hypothetical protein